jgi:hypothetical protein
MFAHLRRHWILTTVIYAPLFIVFLALCARLVYLLPTEIAKLDADKIRALRINIHDVNGTRLPPMPSVDERDKTIEGVDVNHNNIRDDVEQAIFRKYPITNLLPDTTFDTSKEDLNLKFRAANLQYALSQNIYLTKVYDKQTMKAALEQDSKGYSCLASILPDLNLTDEEKEDDAILARAFREQDAIFDPMKKFVEDITLNTVERKNKKNLVYEQYMTGYTLSHDGCNVISL